MGEKEKAKELIEKFSMYVDFTDDFDRYCLDSKIKKAKQCASLCVDEKIKLLDELICDLSLKHHSHLIQLKKIKLEIENYEP